MYDGRTRPTDQNRFLVDIVDDELDDDGMILVRRVSDGEATWVYPHNLKDEPFQ
jgi:hypothetical protein